MVCCMPGTCRFAPQDSFFRGSVSMTVDEFETIRLIDLEDFSQEDCCRQMQVARTTVQAIYASARKKLADVIVNGRQLVIEGGDIQLCGCGKNCAGRRCRSCNRSPEPIPVEGVMKIAVTFENGDVFQHFGHAEQFKLYESADGKIMSSSVVPTGSSGHEALAGFLKDRGVTDLICGGIGAGAKNALADAGIEVYGGVTGNADKAAAALLAGTLSYNPDVSCSHHDHEDGHNCGSEHSCGSSDHKCGSHPEVAGTVKLDM